MSEKKHKLGKLVVVLGPTASGKSNLAAHLARKFNGEIISADSRQIYIAMNVGTNKPTKKEQTIIKHHLIDVVYPDQVYTLAAWQREAFKAIDTVLKKKKTPLLVGGTGLYISSVIFNYKIPQKKGPQLYEALILGMDIPRPKLYKRIDERVHAMIKRGLEKEVRTLSKKYSWHLPSMHGIGYREWQAYFSAKGGDDTTRDAVIKKIQQATRNYAKRQMTWFRMIERGHAVYWIKTAKQAEKKIKNFLKN